MVDNKKAPEEDIPEVSPVLASDEFWMGQEKAQREMLREESDLTEDEITELLATLKGLLDTNFAKNADSVEWNTVTEDIEFDADGNEIFEDEEDGFF